LTDACLLLPAGWLADRSGHHRVFVLGLALTAAAFLLCGGAPAFGWLLGGRVLQGVGAALIFGSAPALVTLASRDAERQRALGWFNLAFGAGAVLGPLAGGALVTAWGWRAVYLTRLPLALAALVLVWRARPRELPGPTRMEAPPTAHAVADRRTFVVANAVNVLANGALFFVWLLVPYYLLERRGLGAGPGGVLFAVGALATALGAPAGGLWADRRGARRLVPVALGAEAVGLLLTSRLDATSSPVAIALALLLAGGGVGLFAAPNMHYVMGALPRARQGWAGSLVVLMRRGGIVAGAGLATFVYEGRLALYRGLGAAEADATARAFTDAFLVASAIAATAAGLSLIPPAVRRDRLGASRGRI
jgi:DHA2 family methylenomycin A resistance protein-like MFS transporter